jgi:two-component system CheB/CheR fusion protein
MSETPTPAGRLQAAADRLLLQEFAPALVLADAQGNILYTSGYIGPYLDAPAGRADWNLHVMARGGLREALAEALALTVARGGSLELPDLALQGPRLPQRVHVTVRALANPPELAGHVLVTFRDVVVAGVPAPRRRGRRASDRTLETEIARARDEMQSLREEMGASQEELQAANEELQSTNEELRSANEELNASREELLAINDEMHAVNHELQSRLSELVLAQSDLRNLQIVSEQAVVFLDAPLRVRGLTEQARALLGLRDEDLGLPLAELAGRLGQPGLVQQVNDTLRTLVPVVRECAGPNGRVVGVQVRPYLRLDGVISGAVLALRDAPDA